MKICCNATGAQKSSRQAHFFSPGIIGTANRTSFFTVAWKRGIARFKNNRVAGKHCAVQSNRIQLFLHYCFPVNYQTHATTDKLQAVALGSGQ